MVVPGSNECRAKFDVKSTSTEVQVETEEECKPFFTPIRSLPIDQVAHLRQIGLLPKIDPKTDDSDNTSDGRRTDDRDYAIQLLRRKHAVYLKRPLHPKSTYPLPGSYLALDASKPWILYWTVHSLDLLDELKAPNTTDEMLTGIVHTLESCWTNTNMGKNKIKDDGVGGFGGGPGQMAHCATSYAAVQALSIISGLDSDEFPTSTKLAWDLLSRKRLGLLSWFLTLRHETHDSDEYSKCNCGYRMHLDGELDVRATYTICSVAALLDILTPNLMKGMINYIVSCQTFEGGFGSEPYSEAHGGYTFCALAALHIVCCKLQCNILECGVDIDSLQVWLSKRQMGMEGGFQGRSNKLVDGCYSFWVGSAIATLDLIHRQNRTYNRDLFDSGIMEDESEKMCDKDENDNHNGGLTFDQELLQRYVLLCGQDINGGLRDKPSKNRDFYHSCYCLSGLSVSQHVLSTRNDSTGTVLYQDEVKNTLAPTHPIFNIRLDRVKSMRKRFGSL